MNYFLRILCQKKIALSPDEVVDFIKDGFFFEPKPQFDIKKQDDFNWEIKVTYAKEKAPVIISTSDNDPGSEKAIRNIKFVLDISKASQKKDQIQTLMNTVQSVYVLEIVQDEITEDCWEMLDAVEAMLMRLADGILHTSDNDFFDAKLKKMYKL